MTPKEGSKVARGATMLALALVMIVSMLATAVSAYAETENKDTTPSDETGGVAVPEEDDGLVIPPASEDTASRAPVVERRVVDEDQDGVADGGSWVFELHIRVDRDGDGNYEYAMDLVIVWSWWDPDEDGVVEVWKWSFLFREYFDTNDDGVREVVRGHRWEREVVDKDSDGNPERVKVDRWSRLVLDVRTGVTVDPADPVKVTRQAPVETPVRQEARWRQWAGDGVPELVKVRHVGREVVDRDSDGNPEHASKVNAGKTIIDRDSDGNPEYRRAHRNVIELFDRDDDGRWDAAHVTRVGYEVVDRNDDGTPDYEHKWSYDDWYYRRIPEEIVIDDGEEDEGASEMPPLETAGL